MHGYKLNKDFGLETLMLKTEVAFNNMKYCAAILALEHYLSIVASLLIPIPSVCTFFTGSVTYCRQHLRNDLKKMKQLQKKVFFVPFFLFKLSFFSNQIHSPAVLAQW